MEETTTVNKTELVKLVETCRICLNYEENMIYLTEEFNKLISLISETEFVIYENLPNFVCKQCGLKLQIVNDLKESLLRTNKMLEEWLGTMESDPSVSGEELMLSIEKPVEITSEEVCTENINNFTHQTAFEEYLNKESSSSISIDPELENVKEEIVIAEETDENQYFSEDLKQEQLKNDTSFTKSETENTPKKRKADKTVCCLICKRMFYSMGTLSVHMKSHTGPEEKSFQCAICGARFARKPLLQGHLTTHSDARPFPCKHCDKAFKTQTNLYIHLQTHSSVKPFKCTKCDYETVQSFSLTMHMKRRHPEMKEEIGMFYSCHLCNRNFSSDAIRQTHVQLRHSKKT